MSLKDNIIELAKKTEFQECDFQCFYEFREQLNLGRIRSAEKVGDRWQTNDWVKQGILAGFRMGKIVKMGKFLDKDTYPVQDLTNRDNLRLVPGGSAVREGAYIASSVIMMPPMYVNVGAYVDEGSMIDSHALVGTCAQIGKNVHLSAAAQIGGVLEPINANPVIIEDEVFVGGNCGVYEGVIVQQSAIIAAGVIITAGTPVYDAVNKTYLKKKNNEPVIIPQNAVVVSGNRPLKSNPEFSVYCPIIIKYRDEKTSASVTLEADLR
ncbi:MAG: 2,3,4,5-tetrahydropyridine-2,6-dicarboxylate N-succinyltransferase [Candidatus Cloacimonetes bacterium]|nr:2,3,4,5-tetrahydropyridine-2,6-dicarboxylate N-succinyltransferase [Candidatus Cloacimonadota bacterium]MCF7814645.1 2,3,4,5-tetrahydropyridine-2,6-dicarboxylate N-succinyltransferase [Candidatus Cloacimonadota bacterium]MCF7869112.1 2,3,4,5-tetrahydropyridine-2,6-dicarboxylate N-succinyltransferase [Candidatus Cloacimonadota bacterium]MCF7884525.1 2,3,4,5-tetrahydropyridine-2,6-dicarboxylate N-succinyltransferase [Candidatus Cloacimonadota bacterium]